MNENVQDVVEGFRRLTTAEQTKAYIEIEKMWKVPEQNDEASEEETPLLPE